MNQKNTSHEDIECSSYVAFFENVVVEDSPSESIKNGHEVDIQENANEKDEFTTYIKFVENTLIEDPHIDSTKDDDDFENIHQVEEVLVEIL